MKKIIHYKIYTQLGYTMKYDEEKNEKKERMKERKKGQMRYVPSQCSFPTSKEN